MSSNKLTALLTTFSILSVTLSCGLTTVQKAHNFEKSYEKLDVEEIANLFKKSGNPTGPLEANTVDYMPTEVSPERKIIIAGRGRDSNGITVHPSIYPFAVAQTRRYEGRFISDQLTDKFDAIEDNNGNEFFALYDGHVVRVKGLLVEVANAVKDLLPLLDKVTHPMIKFQEKDDVIASAANQAEVLRNEISQLIKDTFYRVDQEARKNQEKDKLCATASVVIVTRYNLIVAWLGDIRVLTYDEDLETNRMTSDHTIDNEQESALHFAKGYEKCPPFTWFQPCELTRSFASDYYRSYRRKYHEFEPEIKFVPRYFFDETDVMMSTQFVVLETASIAKSLEDNKVTDIIKNELKYYSDDPLYVNNMYVAMVDKILDDAIARPPPKSHTKNYSVLVIGLEKDDYRSVH